MAIQYPDFGKIPLQKNEIGNIFEDVLQGYKIAKEPEKMAQEKQQRELVNQLKQLEVGHKPQEYALTDQGKKLANALHAEALKHSEEKFNLERDYKKAQIENLKNKPAGGAFKPSGDIGNELYIQSLEAQLGADHPQVKKLREIQAQAVKNKEIQNKSKELYANSLAFRSLPADEKKRAVAMTTGMGIDPTEGEQLLISGKTLSDIAKEKDIDLNKITPVYPVGSENIKQTQRRGAFVKELVDLEGKTTEGMSKYQHKFHGYSLQQIADAMKNDNPDEMGKVLASRALQPEISALRLKVAGGNIGIEALREMTDKSLGELKILQSTISPEAYRAMSKYINKWIIEASNSYEDAINDYGRLKNLGAVNAPQLDIAPQSQSQGFDFSAFPVAGGR